MSTKTQPILETRNLSKVFYTGNALSRNVVKAVQDATLQLYPEKVVALVGESGSGKSTIVRMLARLYDPTSGDILYDGTSVLKEKSRFALLRYRGRVQMIFQDPFSSLNPVHKVSYILERPLRIHHKAPPGMRGALRRQIMELLDQVALTPTEDFIDKYPHQLSGGQRQRVAIARALAVEPKVILADEPISMLDVSIRLGVLNLMDTLRRMHGIGFLYVTHDLSSARYFADEILVMYAGHIVEKANSEELVQNPKHPYTQLLLAAVPDPSRGLRTAEIEIEGEIPDLTRLGTGCPFAPRCSKAMDECWKTMPAITAFADGSWTRCYLYPSENHVPVAATAEQAG
jgi:peptide/nickel transport system ATP-binding protein